MASTYELSPFLGVSRDVDLVRELKTYQRQGNRIELTCKAGRYHPVVYNFYGTRCETTFAPPEETADLRVLLHFCTPSILRVCWGRGERIPEFHSPMVVGNFEQSVEFQLEESEDGLTISTSAISLKVLREPWQLLLQDRKGNVVWATRPVDIEPLRRPAYQWSPPQERWLFLHRYAYPCGVTAEKPSAVFGSFQLHYDEHVYGLGEDFGRLDKRNIERRLWVQECFGNASPAAYKQTPFYMSTRGYGLFVHTSNAVRFDIGCRDHTAVSVLVEDAEWMDLFVIVGETLKEILKGYTDITGRPALPPPWSFGLWMSRVTYSNQQQVEEVADRLRQHDIPCDVIHIDTGWYEREWVCDLKFGKQNFPDPQGMLQRLKEKGFRVSLWQLPNILVESPLFPEAAEKGFFAKRPVGTPYLFSGFLSDAALLDYSNPQMVEWIKQKLRDLFALGVAAIKADFGEGAPPEAVYHSASASSVHNLFPLLYNQAIFEATEEFFGKGNAVIWARSAWAGCQRYPVHWSGDGIARFEDLACVVRSALNFGLSGFVFYSHDVGGFSGLPSPELYARWIQLGAFTSHVRCHGQPPREPWEYGEQTEQIFRKYMKLRYRLLPYILSEAKECVENSLPFLRALILEFQQDPVAPFIEDEYLFGSSFLVAPILDETNRRRVYLPPGRWVDYWTKEEFAGPAWLDIEAALDILPLYVRAGSAIPYGPEMNFVGEKPCDPLTLEVYPAEGELLRTFLSPEGHESLVRYRVSPERFDLYVENAWAPVAVHWLGGPPSLLTLNGESISYQREGKFIRFGAPRGESWHFSGVYSEMR
ncbi:MAG: DUF4968 domain-containing protein [Anaerolineales bacterium]|nr:DUF4968 domain-containing protein [Anaerolineales bacterium]MDW8161964.1 glycoside hydrolase family 31 protein [Anaerolineales bacterium]